MSAPAPTQPCPRCGTPYTPGQEYCLDCGTRLPAATGAFGRWSARLGARWSWFPGEWIWPSLLALAIAALGAGLAIAASKPLDEDPGFEVATGGSVTPTTTAATTLPTAPEPATTATTETQPPATTAPPAPPPRPRIVSWPRGKNGWTIVLISIPQSAGREAARSRARDALSARLPQVGVLDSSRFSSLHPGYYVVFTGIYDTQVEATSALQRARGSYPAAYTRQIAS